MLAVLCVSEHLFGAFFHQYVKNHYLCSKVITYEQPIHCH